jgi:hypothetical protein
MKFDDYSLIEDLSKFNRYTQSRRYNSYKIKVGGTFYSYKEGLDPTTKEMLANEVAFARYVNDASLLFVAPQVLQYENDVAIFEWVDAPHLVEEGISGHLLTTHQVESMVQILAELDRLPTSDFAGRTPETIHEKMDNKYDQWAKQPLRNDLLTQAELETLRALVTERMQHIQPSLQHGDLMFWHIFDTQPLTVYDAEHASGEHARFSDFARVYTSYYVLHPDDAIGLERLTNSLITELNMTQQEFMDAALPVVITKALGKLNDSINDLEQIDYREAARTQIEALLEGKLPTSDR